MGIRNVLCLGLLLLVLPIWIGTIWAGLLGINRKIKYVLVAWTSGFATMMAAAQILLVPLVLRRKLFHVFAGSYSVVLAALAVLAAVLLFFGRKKGKKVWEKSERPAWTGVLFLAGALFLIGVQTYFAGAYQHTDDDDSRFVVLEVLAVEQDVMYTYDPVDSGLSYWDMGEVKKDMTSPWTMFVAYISKISDVAPAILSHKYLPLFLIPMCYAVYALMGMFFFKNDLEKTSIFLILAAALHMYGYSSTHTVSAVMLLRIWQGKALVGALLLPFVFYLLCEMSEKDACTAWYGLAAVAAAAAALASGTGITTVPVMIAVAGLADLIHHRKIKRVLCIWCTAIPSGVYLLCYLFFWQLLKIYF